MASIAGGDWDGVDAKADRVRGCPKLDPISTTMANTILDV
jgi:hypothetical protein